MKRTTERENTRRTPVPWMNPAKTAVLVLLAAALIPSCALLGLGATDEVQASLAAGALLDYVAEQGMDQVRELDTASDTYDIEVAESASANIRAISEDVRVLEYPDVTITVTRELDDNDTTTPTDDLITVTREADYGFEANRINIFVRPVRPSTAADWDSYLYDEELVGWLVEPTNQIDQSGSVSNLLDEVELSSGDVMATWTRVGDDIYAQEIVREMSNVLHPAVVHRTIVSQTDEGETMLVREREVDGIVVHSFTVEQYEDPLTGEIVTRIIRDDGSYAIVIERGDRSGEPRIVEYYSAEGVLVMRHEEVRTLSTGTITSTRTFYGPDGEVLDERVVTYSVNYMEGDEDTVQITRVANGRRRVVQITESGDVYVVTMSGETYLMRVVDSDTVEFLDDAGTVIITAERLADGSWQITMAGETTIV